jgi:hypothetical protein
MTSRFKFAILHKMDTKSKEKPLLSIASACFRQMREHEAAFRDKLLDFKPVAFSVSGKKHLKVLSFPDASPENKPRAERRQNSGSSQKKIVHGYYVLSDEALSLPDWSAQGKFLEKHNIPTNGEDCPDLLLVVNPYQMTLQCYVYSTVQPGGGRYYQIHAFDEIHIDPVLGSQVHYQMYSSTTYEKSIFRKLWSWVSAEGDWSPKRGAKTSVPVATPLLKPYAQLCRMRTLALAFVVLFSVSVAGNVWFVTQGELRHTLGYMPDVGKTDPNTVGKMDCATMQAVLGNPNPVNGNCDFTVIGKLDDLQRVNKDYTPIKTVISKAQKDWPATKDEGLKVKKNWSQLGFIVTAPPDKQIDSAASLLQVLLKDGKRRSELYSLFIKDKAGKKEGYWHSLPSWENLQELNLNVKGIKKSAVYQCNILKHIIGSNNTSDCSEAITDISLNSYLFGIGVYGNLSMEDKKQKIIETWQDSNFPQQKNQWLASPTLEGLKELGMEIEVFKTDEDLQCAVLRSLLKLNTNAKCGDEKGIEQIAAEIAKDEAFLPSLKNQPNWLVLSQPIPQLTELGQLGLTLHIQTNNKDSAKPLTEQTEVDCIAIRAIKGMQPKACEINVEYLHAIDPSFQLDKKWQEINDQMQILWQQLRLRHSGTKE